MAKLDFHALVASFSDNVLLAFICRFLQRLLKEQAVCKDIYLRPEPVERGKGIEFQYRIIEAMRWKDAAQVETMKRQHMQHAEEAMPKMEASLEERFMAVDE
jgi:GntR family transcriptional regulator, transcriptional repressor for pyruvate dehydrogenase complex